MRVNLDFKVFISTGFLLILQFAIAYPYRLLTTNLNNFIVLYKAIITPTIHEVIQFTQEFQMSNYQQRLLKTRTPMITLIQSILIQFQFFADNYMLFHSIPFSFQINHIQLLYDT